jgi:diphosphomevalonate decarboxylase
MPSASALAHPNIAFIKYWGNRDDSLRLPANGSISMNLDGLFTRTRVTWQQAQVAVEDSLSLNSAPIHGKALQRVSEFLDLVRQTARMDLRAEVVSEANFPPGTGIASSASAFAALALAASRAAGLDLDEANLSRLARRGSGSACRSIPAGFVEWFAADSDLDSVARSIAAPDHWQLTDVIAVISTEHKSTGSTEGHAAAASSPLQAARLKDTPRRLEICRRAILERDFHSLAEIVEADSNLMHAIMQTCSTPLFYWQPGTLEIMHLIRQARAEGLPACTTIDAGPNVHVICEPGAVDEVLRLLGDLPGILDLRVAHVGGAAHLVQVE